ncbi:MAG TPA: CpsD/CapB family tyrosine-protein kinase [Gaiellales bacterium]|nr:CpsD/CapB family tyrosine-protein kinase [Gaiellales bacterium]
MTFRRSLRMIGKRWWLMLLGGVVVAALAFLVAGHKKSHYVASTNLTLNDQTVSPNEFGPGLQLNDALPKFSDDWQLPAFQSLPAADAASQKLGGSPSGQQILSRINMTPLSTTQVQLTYTGGSDRNQTIEVLKDYATAFINQRVAAEQKQIQNGLNTFAGQSNVPTKTQQNLAAIANKLPLIPSGFQTGFEANPAGSAAKVSPGGPPVVVIVLGGFLAGVAAGALVALLLGRFDKRVRRPDDIELASVPVVDIDSDADPASVQLLRSELELAGMGTRLAVIAVTRATRAEGSSGLALALARTFASVGTPTVLVSADLRARKVRSETGLSGLLDGSVSTLPLLPLESNLVWLPEGSSTALPETLFSAPRVERIIRDLRDQAGVIVIDTPAVLEDSETLPLLASSDLVLLAVRPGKTRWNPLGSAVALIQRVAKRPLHICYDRADEASSVPAAATRRTDVAERMHQAIEVPAGS